MRLQKGRRPKPFSEADIVDCAVYVVVGRVVVVRARFRPTESEYFVLLGVFAPKPRGGPNCAPFFAMRSMALRPLTLGEAPEPRPRGNRTALAVAHKTGKRIGLDTSTRLAMNAVFAPDRERAAVREPQPFSELSRVARLKSSLDLNLARHRRCL